MSRSPLAGTATAFVLAGAVLASPVIAEVRVFACEPEWAALAKAVGGDDVVVHSATHGKQDAHHVRARPSLIAKVRRADVLFCSGAELESGWLPVLMQRGARHVIQPGRIGHLMAADHVAVLDRPDTIDRSLGDIHPTGNPHVHLDPRNVEILAFELAGRLEQIDPDNAPAYRSRLASFRADWADAMKEWRKRIAGLQGMKVVVHHEAWAYFLGWAGLTRVASLEALPGIPPSASHLQDVLEQSRSAGAEAILRAPYEPQDASDWLAARTGIPVVELPFTVGGHPQADGLVTLFDVTLTLLEEVRDRP